MAEITSNKKARKGKAAKDTVKVEAGPVVLEELEGFTPEEVAHMSEIRDKIRSGQYSDLTKEYRKLLFVQWLIDHEKLRS
ncbi:MAG: hypothetical protein QOH93_553 [Chloroflexia bacterium]|jgi:hypothetical protein|nr:hypothetical protein [Chloroflexia bacterium]